MIAAAWPWITLILLGAWHGLNPGMGWLFCVALGLQQRSKRALFAALIPIALGHAIAIAMVVCAVYVLGAIVPFRWLQLGCAAALLGIALWKVYRLRHPKWVGMCVSFWGPHSLVLVNGKCTWGRIDGDTRAAWSTIDFLRTDYERSEFVPVNSTNRCSGRRRGSYDRASGDDRARCMDRL